MKSKLDHTIIDDVVMDLEPLLRKIDQLRESGFACNFALRGSEFICIENMGHYRLIDLVVDEIYSVTDLSIKTEPFFMYTLTHRNTGLKGIFIAL